MGLQIKQSRTVSLTKKADIMFVIDNSYSMNDCIKGVHETVGDFVSSLGAGVEGQSPVDWRIGLLSYTNYMFRFLDLTDDVAAFREQLAIRLPKGDELTPGAIDFAISNASWRDGAQRVVVIFTDETLLGGKGGEEGFADLLRKIADSRVQPVYYGPDCDFYAKFTQCPLGEVNVVDDFSGISFGALMDRLAVTVSSGNSIAGAAPVVKESVYDLSSIKITRV